MILGTAGHIDHGKTTLVRVLTGVDTDRLPEEKRRGITIDLGFAPLHLDGVGTVGVVDVPGHEAFIRTMVAGVAGIDVALLVIASDEGVMPQTREHLQILALLGIEKAVVALTKADLVDSEWLDLVNADVADLLRGTALDGSPIVRVSARTGAGVTDLRAWLAKVVRECEARSEGPDIFRMPIDRAFTIRGTGTVVTGTVWSGTVARDASLYLRPLDRSTRVRAVQVHGQQIPEAGAGQRVALALSGCDVAELSRGSVLVSDEQWRATSELDAEFVLAEEIALTSRSRLRLHLGTSEVGARIAAGESSRRAGGQSFLGRLILDQPIVARGTDRFVLRLPSPAVTIGGGTVLDSLPPRRRRGAAAKSEGQSRSPAGDQVTPVGTLRRILDTADTAGVSLRQIPIRVGLRPHGLSAAIESTNAMVVAGHAYSASAVEKIKSRIQTLAAEYVERSPLEPGVSLQTLRATTGAPGPLFDLSFAMLLRENSIETMDALVRPPGWSGALSDSDAAIAAAIFHDISLADAEPPSVAEISARYGEKAPSLLRKLERDGQLERVSTDRFYSRAATTRLIDRLQALDPARYYAPAELRDVLGVSRKYLIPFLEFCDRAGITERGAGGRRLRRKGS